MMAKKKGKKRILGLIKQSITFELKGTAKSYSLIDVSSQEILSSNEENHKISRHENRCQENVEYTKRMVPIVTEILQSVMKSFWKHLDSTGICLRITSWQKVNTFGNSKCLVESIVFPKHQVL